MPTSVLRAATADTDPRSAIAQPPNAGGDRIMDRVAVGRLRSGAGPVSLPNRGQGTGPRCCVRYITAAPGAGAPAPGSEANRDRNAPTRGLAEAYDYES